MLQKLRTLGRLRVAMVAAIALLAVVLVGGTLFAANDQRPRNAGDTTDPTGPVLDRMSLQADDVQAPIDLPSIDKEPPTYPNLDSNLNGLAESSAGIHQPTDRDSRTTGQSAETVLVTFYIELDQVDAVRQYLEANEIFVRHVGADYIEAHVPPSMLGVASEQPGVIRVETVIPPRRLQSQTRVISQGVNLHGADVWHSAGYQGDGVKVGIIDDGFEGFSQLQGSELPEDVMARCYFQGPQRPSSEFADCIEEGTHGTVVAETLVDVAPDVELYITNAYSPGDLRDAVEWMAEQGVEVINVSLGWAYDGPGDGTSRDSDSPLNTIDFAVSQGITWVNAAGNSAGRVWYGRFSDPERDGVHNFEPDDVGNALFLPEGSQPTFAMRWDDDWGRADCDLDLELYRNVRGPDGRYIRVGADLTEQDGTPGSEPFAGLVVDKPVTTAQAGVYFLVIRKWVCANDPGWIQLLVYDTSILQYASSGHHMGNPEESRSAGMLAVGATHYWDTAHIAAYSSRGPTIDGRTKPDITGVACGATATNEPFSIGDHQCWFSGTSQSSPHVAGLAALVKQRFPDYGPVETVRYLQENALDRGAPGADNTWGNGFATLPDPSIQSIVTPTANIAVRAGSDSGEVIISWDSVPEASHYRIGYVNMEVDYHFAKASCTGEWIEAFVYVDVNAENIPVSNGRAEYTIRRLAPGARHAFTVLTSDNFVDSGGGGSVSSEFFWPTNPRWTFLPGRNTLPSGVAVPAGECNEPASSSVPSPLTPTANIAVQNGNDSGEAMISWDAVPGASHYRIGYVNMEVDYHLAKASCTGEWIEAFVYVDVNARNIPVSNGRAEYTIRRLSPGARHAFTVLTSNNFVDSGGGGSVSSEFFWPTNPRWTFLPGRAGSPVASRCHPSN